MNLYENISRIAKGLPAGASILGTASERDKLLRRKNLTRPERGSLLDQHLDALYGKEPEPTFTEQLLTCLLGDEYGK
jgi:hypothetical protein